MQQGLVRHTEEVVTDYSSLCSLLARASPYFISWLVWVSSCPGSRAGSQGLVMMNAASPPLTLIDRTSSERERSCSLLSWYSILLSVVEESGLILLSPLTSIPAHRRYTHLSQWWMWDAFLFACFDTVPWPSCERDKCVPRELSSQNGPWWRFQHRYYGLHVLNVTMWPNWLALDN